MKRRIRPIAPALLLTLCAGCATPPALHVIGVHEGKTPPGVDDRPWWAKCGGNAAAGQPAAPQPPSTPPKAPEPPSLECHRQYAGIPVEKEVNVLVTDDSQPIVLALTAYNKTHWKVALKAGVKLMKVILGGYHSQRISGTPAETPIETYTYDPSPCERCWQGATHFYSHEKPPRQLKELTGLEAASFQGRYTGGDFSIFHGMKQAD